MIPIAKPYLNIDDTKLINDVIMSGWVTQGPRVKEFEGLFAEYVGTDYACAVSNCTTALHLALLAVGVKPGDIVITASHSFIATANSVRYCDAEPVFIDIDPNNYCMSPEALKALLTEKCEEKEDGLYYKDVKHLFTKESPLSHIDKNSKIGRIAAIMPVHQIGMPCDIVDIVDIAKKYKIPVVEDAACASGSEIKVNGKWEKVGKPHGDIACFSFHPRKVITTGDGGMITTNNPEYDKYFRLYRQHGMNVPDTIRHSSQKVIVEEYSVTAYNYRMTDIQAALGIQQLKKLPEIVEKRRELDRLYRKYFENIKWLELPKESENKKSNWQSYALKILNNAPVKQIELIQYLLDNGVSSKMGIMNAHKEKPYIKSAWILENSEYARENVIMLPFYIGLTEEEVKKIHDLINKL